MRDDEQSAVEHALPEAGGDKPQSPADDRVPSADGRIASPAAGAPRRATAGSRRTAQGVLRAGRPAGPQQAGNGEKPPAAGPPGQGEQGKDAPDERQVRPGQGQG